jgi:hypothetical protein
MSSLGPRFFFGATVAATTATMATAQNANMSALFSGQSSLAAAALSRLDDGTCSETKGCDKLTGCLAPKKPDGLALMQLPSGGDYDRYQNDLRTRFTVAERWYFRLRC